MNVEAYRSPKLANESSSDEDHGKEALVLTEPKGVQPGDRIILSELTTSSRYGKGATIEGMAVRAKIDQQGKRSASNVKNEEKNSEVQPK